MEQEHQPGEPQPYALSKEAEEDLARSRERYHLLVESTQEYAMFTMDAEARIDSWNSGARRILGWEEEEILGQPGAIIFTPEDRATGAADRELARARETGQAINERWHLCKDGSRFWGSGVVTALWDGERLRGYAKVMRDNTARKQAEQALRQSEESYRKLAASLERLVQERTEQVRQLASELVASEQIVRHRIAGALHDDLQQMLYAAQMQLGLLKEDVSEAGREDLNAVAGLLSRALAVTRQLTVELSPPVLKGEGLAEALQWLANHMQETYGLHVLVADHGTRRTTPQEQRLLLFHAVRELLFNVVKHAGVREARVSLRNVKDGLSVTVSDGGKGFDAPAVMSATAPGFGLNNIGDRLRLLGGHLDLDSHPGGGARVTLYLPRKPELPGEPEVEPPPGQS